MALKQIVLRKRLEGLTAQMNGAEEIRAELEEELRRKQEEAEGCLSVPGKWGITRRPAKVTVRALNRKGETVEYTGSDLLARAFCHELDHLDGKLFTDKHSLVRYLDPDEVG